MQKHTDSLSLSLTGFVVVQLDSGVALSLSRSLHASAAALSNSSFHQTHPREEREQETALTHLTLLHSLLFIHNWTEKQERERERERDGWHFLQSPNECSREDGDDFN